MHEYEPVQGLMWESNAISTAEWTGVKLKDLLAYCGIDLKDERIKHVHFEGLDKDPTGAYYGASIPKEKVLDEYGDVLIAFQMNHKDIPLDHGFPLRAVVPGVIGARSVKWLSKIVISERESASHWQVNDYKLLSPTIKDLKQANFSQIKAIQESSVLSAICEPRNGAKINTTHNEKVRVKGYAFSGGGRAIDRVLVSADNGKTWSDARLSSFDAPLYRYSHKNLFFIQNRK
jgi:sulfite oxidase